ncbi:MAG: hypothetical protein BROFUL_00129 [Candidatus Brocadia fulgida]|uniref:VTT domain-containing protein n=1 Tax=Candidatus Brocadia fulgida TaxID=380242 RepID=A0A0M2UYH5_9BACT|nr:MAG: hypothetical protein BROFUL_00129 [Candidatus Brocadia fulgida]
MVEWGKYFIGFVLHLDSHLYELVSAYGIWVHLFLFLIVFAETGFVATPFLPGDSLLFAAGAVAATGALNVYTVVVLLVIAAILGDTANYWFGYHIGPKIFRKHKSAFFNPEYLERTYRFFEKYGAKRLSLPGLSLLSAPLHRLLPVSAAWLIYALLRITSSVRFFGCRSLPSWGISWAICP